MSAEEPTQSQEPKTFAPLPGRTSDAVTAFDRCLTEAIQLFGIDCPPPSGGRYERSEWRHRARRAIAEAVTARPVNADWFEPLVRAAIYDPDPSFNRRLVEPALRAYGRLRLQEALLTYLREGTDVERAGAARAWYWSWLPQRDDDQLSDQMSQNEQNDLRREWRQTALQVFVDNEDLDVRRCILPGLDLRISDCPDELHPLVAEAIRIARTHPDEYLRHRVEHQV